MKINRGREVRLTHEPHKLKIGGLNPPLCTIINDVQMKNFYRLIQGDCLKVLSTLKDESVDLVLTDPPFKVSQMYGGGVDADNLINVASILRTLPEISRVLKKGKWAILFYDNRILPFLFKATEGTDLVYRRSIFLYRRWGLANRWMGWMQCTDPICFFVKGHTEPFQPKVKGKVKHDCYVKSKPENEDASHVAQKPLELIKDIIFWCSDDNDLVLDPYLGSGTTIRGCQDLRRNCIGIEINPEYCEIAKKRCFGGQPLDREVEYSFEVFEGEK